MKEGIHPRYPGATVTCACGNVIQTASTKGDFKVDVCNMCHPFFTGKERQIASAGRVEKFNKKYRTKGEEKRS
jgi:large subunit ribosomal protein L31